jgi:hypothetical protein
VTGCPAMCPTCRRPAVSVTQDGRLRKHPLPLEKRERTRHCPASGQLPAEVPEAPEEMSDVERRGRYGMGWDVLLVPCPRCCVPVGERCRIGRGHYAHEARYTAMLRASHRLPLPDL